MKTQRLASIFSFAAIAVLLVIVGCRREVEEKPTFPDVSFFTPGEAQVGDTIKVVGLGLLGSKVSLGNQGMTLISNSDQALIFAIPAGASTAQLTVSYPETGGHTFQAPLVIDDKTGNNELLIGDFDLGGIRPAGVTNDFLNGQWQINSAGAATTGIGQGVNGVPSSPAGGNYAYAFMGGEDMDPTTYGFVADLGHRSEVLNDKETPWPVSYLLYPAATLDTSAAISDYYLNFYVNFNGRTEGRVRIFLINPNYDKECRYATTISPTNSTADQWVWKSIKLSTFQNNYGFGNSGACSNQNTLSMSEMLQINSIEIGVTDKFDSNYDVDCCYYVDADSPSDLSCCETAVPADVDQVEVYIDHVIISQGGPVGPRYE